MSSKYTRLPCHIYQINHKHKRLSHNIPDYPLNKSDYPLNIPDYPLNKSDNPLNIPDYPLNIPDYPLIYQVLLLKVSKAQIRAPITTSTESSCINRTNSTLLSYFISPNIIDLIIIP